MTLTFPRLLGNRGQVGTHVIVAKSLPPFGIGLTGEVTGNRSLTGPGLLDYRLTIHWGMPGGDTLLFDCDRRQDACLAEIV